MLKNVCRTLLVGIVLYMTIYYASVDVANTPTSVNPDRDKRVEVPMYFGNINGGWLLSSWFFYPIHFVDRRLRPAKWNPNVNEYVLKMMPERRKSSLYYDAAGSNKVSGAE